MVTVTGTTYMTQEGQPAQVCVTKNLETASSISGVITAYPIVASNAATRECTTTPYVSLVNLNLNFTALVQFKNGSSYSFTLASGLMVSCVNITTYDDTIQRGPIIFNASIGATLSTGGAVTVGNLSTSQVTIVDINGKKHIRFQLQHVKVMVCLFSQLSPSPL